MKSFKHTLFSVLCLTLLSSCFAGSSEQQCRAEIVANDKIYDAGFDPSPEKALQNGCNKYCLETDSECEALYQTWLSSPKGKPGTTKMKAMYEDQRILDCVTITCANRCVGDVDTGKLKANSSCK